MQVNLDVTPTRRTQVGQPVEILRVIFVLRKEERVSRRSPVAVAKAFEQTRVLGTPAVDTTKRCLVIGVRALWFKVVADRKEHVDRVDIVIVCTSGAPRIKHSTD